MDAGVVWCKSLDPEKALWSSDEGLAWPPQVGEGIRGEEGYGRGWIPRRLLAVAERGIKHLDTGRVAPRGDVMLGRLDVHGLRASGHSGHAQRRSSCKAASPCRDGRCCPPGCRHARTGRDGRHGAPMGKGGVGGEGGDGDARREGNREDEEGADHPCCWCRNASSLSPSYLVYVSSLRLGRKYCRTVARWLLDAFRLVNERGAFCFDPVPSTLESS